jgi:hypothetical protein
LSTLLSLEAGAQALMAVVEVVLAAIAQLPVLLLPLVLRLQLL